MSRYMLGEFEKAVLLALVRLRDNAYGVTIRRELSKRLQRDVAVGAVYTTLSRLEEKGYVSSSVGEPTPERGGRAKRYFRIEATGAEALNRSITANSAFAGLGKLLGQKA
jgi:PadR family transcriptional regulator PadR